jgi:hypothetical protein
VADLFEEVEGQLRSDRYKSLVFKVAPWVAALLAGGLLAAFAVWGWQRYEASQTDKASDAYAQAIDAAGQGQPQRAERLWNDVAKSRAKGYASLALMQIGGLRLQQNKAAEAVKLFDQAAQTAPNPIIADAARLKSAFALMDSAPYKDVEARLKPLMDDGRPYRVQAREALAFAKLQAGDVASARTEFAVISQMLDAMPPARERADAAMQLIDSGSAKAVPGAVKAAALLPPVPGASTPAAPQPQASGSQ